MSNSELELTETSDQENEEIDLDQHCQPVEGMETKDAPRSKPKRGQPVHSVWGFAFDNPNAHCKTSPNNAVCKHCKQIVRHRHKTKSVKAHLKKCKLFKKIMLDTAVSDRPDWWTELMNAAKKSTNSTFSSSSSSSSTLQPSMR